jgi:HK97 family phage prohead protease
VSVRPGHLEVRQEGGDIVLRGLACRTAYRYDMGDYVETIASGSFKRSLSQSPDVVLNVNHSSAPLARTRNGSLDLWEDQDGLQIRARLDPEDSESVAVARKIERGLFSQLSFAFNATSQRWNEPQYTERLITGCEINKGDVSVVTHPASDGTHVALEPALAPGPGELVGSGRRAAVSTLTRGNREKERLAVLRAGPIARPTVARAMTAGELTAQQLRTRSTYERLRLQQLRKGA